MFYPNMFIKYKFTMDYFILYFIYKEQTMFSSSNIILMIIIALFVIFLFYNNTDYSFIKNNNEKIYDPYNSNMKQLPMHKYKYSKHRNNYRDNDSIMTEASADGSSGSISWNSTIGSTIMKGALNPNYVDIQFHNDYRDIITAIGNLVSEKRQRFNIANIPLKYSEPQANEVKAMIMDFINVINDNVASEVPNQRNPNTGWDEAVVDPTVESGWNKIQKSLGLAVSLYEKPASKNLIKLIAIQKVQKYETEDEIKYVIKIVIQKLNTEDQMILNVSFVQDKRPLNDENNFFVTKNIDMKVIIEDIFVIGYLSEDGPNANQQYDMDQEKYYEYDGLEKNNMTDPKYIQKILMENYKKRSNEMNNLTNLLDEEGQDFHKTLSEGKQIYDFDNIKGTRTIFNDMNEKKVFY